MTEQEPPRITRSVLRNLGAKQTWITAPCLGGNERKSAGMMAEGCLDPGLRRDDKKGGMTGGNETYLHLGKTLILRFVQP